MIKFKFIRDLSIRNKIIVIVLFVTFLIHSIGFTFITIWDINSLKTEIQTGLVLNTRLVANNCIVPLTFGDDQQAAEALTHLKEIESIETGCLFDKEGNVFATYPDTLNENSILELKAQRENIFQDGFFYVHEPVLFQNEQYGSIIIKADSKPLKIARRKIIITLVLLSLVLDLLSIILASKMQAYISSPIIDLKNHFDRIAENSDFSDRILNQYNDEIGSLYDGFNNMLGQVILRQDERDKAIDSLSESEKYNRVLFESSPIGLALCRMDGSLVDINSAYAKIIGREVEETKKLTYWDITPEKYSNKEQVQLENLEKTGHYGPYEKEYIHKNGELIPVSMSGIILKRDGKQYIWSSVENITERKQAENDRDKVLYELGLVNRVILKINQESSLDAMAEILAKAVYELNPGSHVAVSLYDGRTGGVQIKSIVGLDKNQEKIIKALGKDPRKIIFDPQKLDKVYTHYTSGKLILVKGGLAELMAGHVPGLQSRIAEKLMGLEAVYTAGFASNEIAKGGVVILLKKGREINSPSAIETLVAQTSQVIQKKQAETEIKNLNKNLEKIVKNRTAQLENANKELEAFSYSVSHDLKAPLRAVIGFSQILNEDFGHQLEPESKRYIGLIKDNAENMGKLINDLLNFSRMGRAELQKSQIDLHAIAQRVKSELKSEFQNRKLTINIKPMPLINADEKLMYHVMLNLIGNAVKFTSKVKNARVELGCSSQNSENIFYVKDNGIGFDMKYAGKIYDVFQRLHTVEEFPGTGIGLSIVQRILQKHEGRIWVESEKNLGTTFFFTV